MIFTSVLHCLDALCGHVDEFNNLFHAIVNEEGGKWIDMSSQIDPDDLSLYSNRDSIHLSNNGVAVFMAQLDKEISKPVRPRANIPTCLIPRLWTRPKARRSKKGLFKYCIGLHFELVCMIYVFNSRETAKKDQVI